MDCLLAAGFAFLIGFRIAAYMSKKHLERMKVIWGVGADGQAAGSGH